MILQLSENAIAFHDENLFPIVAACGIGPHRSGSSGRASRPREDRELFEGVEHTSVSSVMFDASEFPNEDNVSATADVVRWAHSHNVHVEAELGEVGEGRAQPPAFGPTPTRRPGSSPVLTWIPLRLQSGPLTL